MFSLNFCSRHLSWEEVLLGLKFFIPLTFPPRGQPLRRKKREDRRPPPRDDDHEEYEDLFQNYQEMAPSERHDLQMNFLSLYMDMPPAIKRNIGYSFDELIKDCDFLGRKCYNERWGTDSVWLLSVGFFTFFFCLLIWFLCFLVCCRFFYFFIYIFLLLLLVYSLPLTLFWICYVSCVIYKFIYFSRNISFVCSFNSFYFS